jgi:mannose/cellobiose epimerase-like protein (N-acyl-D-glucosamine 2-epimerase family)
MVANGLILLLASGGIDAVWFDRTLRDEVQHWLDAAATESGFFRPFLDRQWKPLEQQSATLVSQSRLIYVTAAGYEHTRRPEFREAARRGAAFLLTSFRDQVHGGWYYRVSPDGQPLQDFKDSYGYAFAIFGLTHAYKATGEERFLRAAGDTWTEMKSRLRDGPHFLKPRTSRDYSGVQGTNSQNPLMHLFEALLELSEAGGSKDVRRDAEALASAVTTKLVQPEDGSLPEMFNREWAPLPAGKGGRIEIGHQFEWAFLLSRAVELGFPKSYLKTARRLLDYGMRVGYDKQAGGIWSVCDYSGRVASPVKSWWQQAELLRALAHHAKLRGRTDLWPAYRQSLEFVKTNFIDGEFGGWYNNYDPAAPRTGRREHKGTDWMVGYHVTGFYSEALRQR